MSEWGLRVGFGVADVTPPTGLAMCGGLQPRTNVGTEDPLLAKALVAESGGKRVALVGVDLIGLPREIADPAIAEAARRTGIDPGAILVSCSHTHSGPYTVEGLYSFGVADAGYLSTLPALIADAVERGAAALRPATMHIGRSLVYHGLHHRRVLCKREGKALNTWMGHALDDLDRCPQILGTCGPIDPELWVARFDDAAGKTFGVFWNLSLHVNSRWGEKWSADYPAVVADAMAAAFGPRVTTVFAPGACANVNPVFGEGGWKALADELARQVIAAARRGKRIEGSVQVDGVRRDVRVARRDPASQPPEAIGRLDWGGSSCPEVFEPMLEHIGALPEELVLPVNAGCLGPLAIASNPGELFVEHGLTIKQRSPFPHTVVAQLTNDLILYQPTRQAFEQQGYETLVGANRVSIEGIEKIVDAAAELLQELWQRGGAAAAS